MRIRKRLQTQIPISTPDLAIPPACAHAGAPSPVASAGGAVVVDVSLLHQDGDLPIQPGGCNVHGPTSPCGAAEGGDLPRRPNPHRPVPSSMRSDNGDDGRDTAAQMLLLLHGEQDREVVDAHRRTWSLGGLRSVHGSGAEDSRSTQQVVAESFPVKKRRGTVGGGRFSVEVEESKGKKPVTTNHESTRTGTIPTSAGTAAYVNGNTSVIKNDGGVHAVEVNGKNSKRKSTTLLMEGSRCSRVNGRGWRCCQQTLVGYSLCEHHLGKGRLRSVSSVKCNNNRTKKGKQQLLQKQQQESSLADHGDSEAYVASSNRKRKIGMVKARSLSSLLDQTNHRVATTEMPPVIPLPAKQDEESPLTLHVRQS